MKSIDSIPVSKMQRASKLVGTGVKIGANYLKYYGEKLIDAERAEEKLNQDNADDIYNTLKSLKGSALKLAQMLSMERNILPKAYVDKFSLAQFSVPPLSGPLVRKTLKKHLGKTPEELFDEFSEEAISAASIGQVHLAVKNNKRYAVKIQYPGVAESIGSDLALVKPIASKMFNIKMNEAEQYFTEVEKKLLEETDYQIELQQSIEMSEACAKVLDIKFPKYYPEWSSKKVLVMDFMKGKPLGAYVQKNKSSQAERNAIGQTLWDFYMFQIHGLRKVQADPHPGNFLINKKAKLVAIDFGCIKKIPENFYGPYFDLSSREVLNDAKLFEQKLEALEILTKSDSKEERKFFTALFHQMLTLFTKPFQSEEFDFGDATFWDQIGDLAQQFTSQSELRKMNNNRGSKHFIYVNRTFFGLYSLLNDLKAKVEVNRFKSLI
jgi:predicted unusual protein kinase regulating ubiquinone biosynthesis (AarF/ABC1/UbiB family)